MVVEFDSAGGVVAINGLQPADDAPRVPPSGSSDAFPSGRSGATTFRDLARAAAQKHRVPVGLFFKLVARESNWNTDALSPKGAIGLAQLMPETAKALGVDPADPAQNLEGGARYLRAQFERFGTWRLALGAYNAGPEAVERHGKGVPPYRETRAFVATILGPKTGPDISEAGTPQSSERSLSVWEF